MRQVIGTVLAVIASALTMLFVVMVFDFMTTDYIGSEVAAAKFIIGFVGLLTTATGLSAVAVLRSHRREKQIAGTQSNRT